ncbi:Uncharacterised protein [Achromobacter sp. 2789STDY5608615]|uniref:phage tail protein n=1 Tax=Achromobacter sp. 2789STDY5608615 TaxID=1806492 RepID=UPI0006C0F72C|nr:phage tail protein [Achromobacter sp. 2789STDY5608615]CUK22158.1 Uncharacterised protein [Achromobacter sp. 2789STDY5608615]
MTTYFGILTKIGEAKEANAKALGVPVNITELEVGDGGGVLPVPSREQTSLIGSKHRAPINRKFVDPSNPAWLVVEQVIPEQFGGWWVREMGLRDADGDLVAVCNCPPTYKPQMAEGSARTQVVRMVLQVSSTSNFTLKIDPAVVLATRQLVEDGLAKKLDKTDTAAAALKLSTARSFSITGGATAEAKSFDGTAPVALNVTGLDMSKANAGTLSVTRGGTGLATIAAGNFVLGADNASLTTRTPSQVLTLIAGASLASPALTGEPTAPTPEPADSSNRLATTEFVLTALSGISVPQASTATPGISRRATSPEAQSLTRDDLTISPASLRAAFQGSNYSATYNGFDRMPGGMTRNWGVVPQVTIPPNSTLEANITFPEAFLQDALIINLTIETSAPTQVSCAIKPGSLTKTGFTVIRGNSSTSTPWNVIVRYEAYGR